jgi:transcriptional regulator with XRE-family HTH domain
MLLGFGERLKQIRLERGLRQEDIGQVVRVGKSTVSQWESGIHVPSLGTVAKIADYLDVTTDYLLGRADHPQGRAHRLKVNDGLDVDDQATPKKGNPLDRLKGIRGALRADKNLTEEDVQEILDFIEWRKQKKRSERTE